jgi:hypothetical protein
MVDHLHPIAAWKEIFMPVRGMCFKIKLRRRVIHMFDPRGDAISWHHSSAHEVSFELNSISSVLGFCMR